MADTLAQMPTDFPSWYASVSLNKPEAAAARWPGVAEAIKGAKSADIEALVRMAFNTRQPPSSEAKERFVKAVHGGDQTFDSAAVARETQVLAGSALMHMVRSNGRAAMAVSTAALAGGRNPGLPMDLVGHAENAIRALAESSRRRASPGELTAPTLSLPAATDDIAPKEMVENLRASIQLAFNTAAASQNRILKAFRDQQNQADEELQMLWWLTGGCTTSGAPFESIDSNARPFTLAKELADRTSVLPGPGSIRSLLSRAGLKSTGKITVPQAVNAASDSWSKDAVGEREPSPVTLPIHSALHRRIETGAGDAWIKNWAAVTGIPEKHALNPLVLAELFYRERLQLIARG